MINLEGDFSTNTSRKGRAILKSFSKVKRREGLSEFRLLCKKKKKKRLCKKNPFPSICSWTPFHQNLLPTKRIRVQFKDCALMTLSHWSFSSQSRLGFFLLLAAPFLALSILTILLYKCQTKSCFEDMNILITAILKFFTTNQLINKSFFFKLGVLQWGSSPKWPSKILTTHGRWMKFLGWVNVTKG